MDNNFEIREKMGSYQGLLLVLVWVLAITGGIAGCLLAQISDIGGLGVFLIIVSIVGGIIGHILVNVALAVPFILLNNGDMLNEIKQRLNVINSKASPSSGSAANLAEKLAAMGSNTAAAPYTVTLEQCNISDNWGAISTVVQNAGKYVILDLSSCTATDNTIRGNRDPTGNDFNIIKGNEYIKGIILPDSLSSIGTGAFYKCVSLTSVTIPSSVTSIGASAFYCCVSLTGVTIPSSVTSTDDFAFSGCVGLTSVTFDTGSNISEDNFGNGVFPEGHYADGGNTLKKAYATGKAGTYTRAVSGSVWTKQE